MAAAGLIDVHHHIVPVGYRGAIDAATGGSVGGIPQPPWDEQTMLDRMDQLGVDRALLSVSAPALSPIAADARPALARSCNTELAALRAAHAGRIGGFAVLPLPDVAAALTELAFALDELRLDGVSLLTNYDGRYLGDPDFEPVLAELDRRGVVAHVHPNLPPATVAAQLMLPAPVLEFTFDTTRMVAELILAETLLRYDRLTLVLSHLGGTLPWVAWRLSMLDEFPSARGGAREPVREQLRRLYYDVALSASASNLTLALEVIGAERLLYGSDVPFAPASFIDANTASLTHRVDGVDLLARTRDNAERLFA